MVRVTRDYTGRGPTKARTYIAEDTVTCVLQDTLTKGEQKLVEQDDIESVRQLRRRYQDLMQDDAVRAVEEIMERRVLGFLSDNMMGPDIAAEVHPRARGRR
jgi:uncharacterized protein YbcI